MQIDKGFIKVATIFKNGSVVPVWFEWNKQKFNVDRITYRWQERKGRAQILYFTVMSGSDLYNIEFDTENMVWQIAGIED